MTRLCMWCRVRVANELGAGNGRGAKFATAVAVTQSIVIGLFFWILIIFFHNELALIFSTSQPVLEAVHKLSILLAFTVLLNSVQPILSGKSTSYFFLFELYIHIKKLKIHTHSIFTDCISWNRLCLSRIHLHDMYSYNLSKELIASKFVLFI